MLKSYLRIAWRNLSRTKGYSALNILGLATGMTVALLIGLWVHFEFSFDRFLPGYNNLFQVVRNFDDNGQTLTFSSTSLKLADQLRNTIPGLEIAETDYFGAHGLIVGDKKFYMGGAQVNENFLRMFEYPMESGNAASALSDPFSIVLTESTARALFGSSDPLGKIVKFDNRDNLKVSGVLKDIPTNSSFQFSYLVPFSYLEKSQDWVKEARKSGYGYNAFQIFARLKSGVSLQQVSRSIKDIEKSDKDNINAVKSDVILRPMWRWHLYGDYSTGRLSGGLIDYVRMFSIIGLLVLIIACINFVNLETARSERRAREVGVRKAIGSHRSDLIFQFLTESFLLSALSFGCAMVLSSWLLPWFNALADTNIQIPWMNPVFWVTLLVFLCLVALLAGAMPAFYLSSFQPVRVLKGLFSSGRQASLPRKILVVTQFTCSIALIVSTIVIYEQIQYAKNRPTGFETNRVLVTYMNDDLRRNYTALKNDMLQQGITDAVTTSSSPATEIGWHSDVDRWPGKMAGETVEMGVVVVDQDYFKTMRMTLAAGRIFDSPADTTAFLFNETAIRRLRLKDPVGQPIQFQGVNGRIIGVMKDAMMVSPFSSADPTIFVFGPNPHGNLIYHLSPRIGTEDALTRLTAIFNKYEPSYPYKYDFVDKTYAAKFDLEMLIGKLSGIFAGLAIFISCLGLLGLAAYTAEQRTREIGIRKVLGASVPQVWMLLSRDFILLVTLSALIASPLAFYFLQRWLLKYDYRITIHPVVFLLAGATALFITLLTVSFQAIRAALANPVKSLRTE